MVMVVILIVFYLLLKSWKFILFGVLLISNIQNSYELMNDNYTVGFLATARVLHVNVRCP